ncbi:P-loop containing nucleoside triphosphate hydrolase protein [Mycena filopes]|nr:P-loop containing nucleoside triphosphate hydrolase protein [Mycena filopes]
MQGLLWARCRPRVASLQWVACRFRQQTAAPRTKKKAENADHQPERQRQQFGAIPVKDIDPGTIPGLEGPDIPLSTVSTYFHANAAKWTLQRSVHDRLVAFGATSQDATKLLAAFARDVSSGCFDTPEAFEKYHLIKLSGVDALEADISFSNIFFRWLTLRGEPSPSTSTLLRLAQAATNLHPAEDFEDARKMRRKFIMHVGPTNSGKTHHALRALAAANVGVYAGPLRLLAHEVWERLNYGQIAPLGATEEQIAEAAKVGESTTNPFARLCNMITGEEQKIVGDNVKLFSCTVEMLNLARRFDVAVIDEIQMITSFDRGSGWTRAVLGICANEVHLCGEETAVPLIEKLLEETGDELVVNRYERLTPLTVEKESLNGDLSKVVKGDCIVAFSRPAIFALKREIEAKTRLKCAVVYGRLPPEIRSEQAALFNDPNSGYDVLVGSDAIGMGLNLKIRRVIFEAIEKYEGIGRGIIPISVSQMKQIAGRAGRFGMETAGEAPGGFVTTLKRADLPILRRTLPLQLPPLLTARTGATSKLFSELSGHLPPNSSTETIFLAHSHAGTLPVHFRRILPAALSVICDYIDQHGSFTHLDRLQLTQAPFPWRDRTALQAITDFIDTYYKNMHVSITETMRKLGYIDGLDQAELAMNAPARSRSFQHGESLMGMESFHKILVAYLWLSYRNPVSYPEQALAVELKERVERALHWCLQEITSRKARGPTTNPVKKPTIEFWRTVADAKAKEEVIRKNQPEY